MSIFSRRRMLFLPLGAVLAGSAIPSLAARRVIDLRGEWQGELVTDEETYPISMDVVKQNRRTGRFRGRADMFGEVGSLRGEIRRSRKVSATVRTHFQKEPITMRFNLAASPDGEALVGTGSARSRAFDDLEGIVTLSKI